MVALRTGSKAETVEATLLAGMDTDCHGVSACSNGRLGLWLLVPRL